MSEEKMEKHGMPRGNSVFFATTDETHRPALISSFHESHVFLIKMYQSYLVFYLPPKLISPSFQKPTLIHPSLFS